MERLGEKNPPLFPFLKGVLKKKRGNEFSVLFMSCYPL